jgi:Flp pilus assembly protein TadG
VSLSRFLVRLRDDTSGAAILEFALLGPAFIAMLLGVLQVGMGLQSYNAMRTLSADVARYAMIQYSTGNRLNNEQLRGYAVAIGQSAPYMLNGDHLSATVTTASTQRVTGATELKLLINYEIPTLFDSMGVTGPTVTYARPIFLTEPDE